MNNKFQLLGLMLILVVELKASQGLGVRSRAPKQFARQVAPAQPTGYPAAGVTPAVPFEEKPDSAYLPPDNAYGPPATAAAPPPAAVEIPVEEAAEAEEPVTPAQEDDVLLAVGKDGTVIAVSTSYDESKNGRLIQRRIQQQVRGQQIAARPERLVSRPNVAILPRLVQAPERFAYTVQVQQW